jgi:hypothetical protein
MHIAFHPTIRRGIESECSRGITEGAAGFSQQNAFRLPSRMHQHTPAAAAAGTMRAAARSEAATDDSLRLAPTFYRADAVELDMNNETLRSLRGHRRQKRGGQY